MLGAYAFDAFGLRTGTDSTTDPYAGFGGGWGYYADTETGLSLLGHRYYDTGTGRFVTRDPIGYDGGINLYAYTANNPVNDRDPSGLDPLHHSFPKYLGGDPDQPLTDMENQANHDALHNEMRQFLRNQRNAAGKDMEGRSGNPGRNIRRNFTPEEIEDALGKFYRGPGSKFPNAARDFFRQCPKQTPEAIVASRMALAARAAQAAAEAREAALVAEAAEALVVADEAAIVVGIVVK